MELSQIITLTILSLVTVFLIIMGFRAYWSVVPQKKSKEKSALNALLFDMLTTNNCAEKPEYNSGSQIKNVEPYLNDSINLEIITRKCCSDD